MKKKSKIEMLNKVVTDLDNDIKKALKAEKVLLEIVNDKIVDVNIIEMTRVKADRMIFSVFGKVQLVYPMNGRNLKECRETLGVSRKKFAKLCHWTEANQRSLEETLLGSRAVARLDRDKICTVIVSLSGARQK